MAHRQFLCLYFPCLQIDRLQIEYPYYRALPLAAVQEENSCLYITAVNTSAALAGVRVGTRLADARAGLSKLHAVPQDPTADGRIRERLIHWCHRYSPLVADDGHGGIVIDIKGCVHLFGGEAVLLGDVQSRIRRSGYRVRGAIAHSFGAAWALARYGKQNTVLTEDSSAVLDSLPVGALRLPDNIVSELRGAGLTTIKAVRNISRQALEARYGPVLLLRLDQTFHCIEEPIIPYREPTPYRAVRTLVEPVATVAAIQHALSELLNELCFRLAQEQAGARWLILHCYRMDGTVVSCSIGTSRPVRSVTHLMRLFSEKLDKIDAGFGIESLVLFIPEIDRDPSTQLCLPCLQDAKEGTAFDELIDRLGMRLGFAQICRLAVRESFSPESVVRFEPVIGSAFSNPAWPEYRLRPVRLIHPPLEIHVSTVSPGQLPIQFGIRQQLYRIVRMEGPERITAEWWQDQSPLWELRDYYRIEDDRGNRLWIFCEMQPNNSSSYSARWFLQGHFP